VVTRTVNALNRTAPARRALEATLGVERTAWRPELAERTFRSTARADATLPVRDGERTPGRLALLSTCYVNYNEPDIGDDLLKILAHNAIPVTLAKKEVCCGMPKLELGDLAASSERRSPTFRCWRRLRAQDTGSFRLCRRAR